MDLSKAIRHPTSIVESVRREIADDIADNATDGLAIPNDTTIAVAIQIAQALADRFWPNDAVKVVGFVGDDGEIGIVAHSMDSGRRITFYVTSDAIRAIRTGATEKPSWFQVEDIEQIPSLLDWV